MGRNPEVKRTYLDRYETLRTGMRRTDAERKSVGTARGTRKGSYCNRAGAAETPRACVPGLRASGPRGVERPQLGCSRVANPAPSGGGGTADGRLFEKGDKMKKTGIKIQTTLEGEVAELFLAACKRNHRKMAGEAAVRIEHTLMEEKREIEATVARQKEI